MRLDFEVETFAVQTAPTPHVFDARQSDVLQYGDFTGPLDTCGSTIGVMVPQPAIAFSCKDHGADATEDGTGRGQPIVTAFKPGQSEAAGGIFLTTEFAPTLQAANNGSTAVPAVQYGMAVRRLTPRECEKLQGFPPGYTQVPVRGKPAADGPRYKAIGNSWAVPVVRWIGARVDAELCKLDGKS